MLIGCWPLKALKQFKKNSVYKKYIFTKKN